MSALRSLHAFLNYDLARLWRAPILPQDRLPPLSPLEQDFASHVLAGKICDEQAIQRAHIAADRDGMRLDQALVKLGLCREEERTQIYAAMSGFPIATRAHYPATPVLTKSCCERYFRAARLILIACDSASATLAMEDPFDDFARAAMKIYMGRDISCMVARPVDIDRVLAKLYPNEAAEGATSVAPGTLIDDAERLTDMASDAPTIKFVNRMLVAAVEANANDVHIDNEIDRLRVQFRCDGVLRVEPLGQHPPLAVISRLKILAKLDIADRENPQDGRFSLPIRGLDIDVRMSTMPGLYGETVALRLLNQTRGPPPLDALEIPAHLIGPWRDAMRISHGLVLVTGPTGSGKTTTIAASLREIADGDRHIITIEDPIEYRIEGLNQKQVRPEFGMTFAHTLRAALRHDPDVIVVGEIRDAETASVALQAATTGHLVISTLHTASACGAITRLLNLGVPLHMLRNNLHTVMAQRLVRRCCPTCRHTAPAVKKCPDCGGTGFHGRRSVLELLTLSEPLWKEFGNCQNDAEVEAIAMRQGFMTMGQMGDVLVKMGETTQSELRLAGVQRAA